MRKAIFIFIAIVLVAASIDWIRSCSGLKSHKEVFGRELTYADMYEYKDADYDYVVRVPSFFTAQADSLQDEKGRMRFEYGDQWITVVIESHVMHNNGQSLKNGMDSLAQVLKATDRKLGSDYFILSGPQYENGRSSESHQARLNGRVVTDEGETSGSLIEGYSYYSKVMTNHKLWFVYTMVYPDDYKDILARLFKEIDDWQIWVHHPQRYHFRQRLSANFTHTLNQG